MHLLWILPWTLSAIYVGSPRFFGSMAAARTGRLLKTGLRTEDYRIFNDIVLGGDKNPSHIDHVVIARYGIVVIDSMCVSGQVKGTEVQLHWKAVTTWRKREFDNPFYANHFRVLALAQALELPTSRFVGLIVFNGRFRLADGVPGNVIAAEAMVRRLQTRAPEIFTGDQIDRIAQRLRETSVQSPTRRGRVAWKVIQFLLFLGLFATSAFVFREALSEALTRLQSEMVGSKLTARALRESRPSPSVKIAESELLCAYSADTGRCACYEPKGAKFEIDQDRCQEIAERGSILKK